MPARSRAWWVESTRVSLVRHRAIGVATGHCNVRKLRQLALVPEANSRAVRFIVKRRENELTIVKLLIQRYEAA
jgi:hypothetical protein